MINNIQVLRAFSALVIAFFHLSQDVPYLSPSGRFGVDIFFVISGFIMSLILDGGETKFLQRRLIRVIPLYWLATLAVVAIVVIAPNLLMSTSASAETLAKSLLFIPYVRENGLIQPVLFIGWTLNYEVFFYLMISGALFVASGSAAVALAASSLALLSLYIQHSGCTAVSCTFYGDPLITEFLFGYVAYRLYRSCHSEKFFTSKLVLATAGAAGSIALLIWAELNDWPGGRLLTGGLPALLLIACAAIIEDKGLRLSWTPLVLLGNASYALYLSHPYVERGFLLLCRRFVPFLDPVASWTGSLLCLSVVCIVGVAVHCLVERPLLRIIRSRVSQTGLRRSQPQFSPVAVSIPD